MDEKVKRFVVFAGDEYYPGGGWEDYQWSFDTLPDAIEFMIECAAQWAHIIDLETGRRVEP